MISNGVNTKYYANARRQSFKQTFYWAAEDNKTIGGEGGDPHKREKLDAFIRDYNAMVGTKFSTKDTQSFYNYYQDIAKKVKDRKVDILLVVNMFLTGFCTAFEKQAVSPVFFGGFRVPTVVILDPQKHWFSVFLSFFVCQAVHWLPALTKCATSQNAQLQKLKARLLSMDSSPAALG